MLVLVSGLEKRSEGMFSLYTIRQKLSRWSSRVSIRTLGLVFNNSLLYCPKDIGGVTFARCLKCDNG